MPVIAALVGCLFVGKRIGYPREPMAPHSLTMTMIGASLLWVGWFGFNAGSNLEARRPLAFVNTMVATAAATLSWLFVEWIMKGKPSMLGMASGAVAGLVAITPGLGLRRADGFGGPRARGQPDLLVLRRGREGEAALRRCARRLRRPLRRRHRRGPSAPASWWRPYLGGTGITDYTNFAHNNEGTYEMGAQVIIQCKAVLATLLYSGIGSAILYKIVDLVIGLRVSPEKEREGLDISEHSERAYNY